MITSAASFTAASTATTTSGTGLGGLGTDAFLQLLVAQLKYQNPMAPTDGAAMLQQTAQFSTVETLKEIAETNQQLMGFQQVGMALNLVGSDIEAVGLDGLPVTGTVASVRFTSDGPFLKLANGREVPMNNVISVSAPTPPPQTPPAEGD